MGFSDMQYQNLHLRFRYLKILEKGNFIGQSVEIRCSLRLISEREKKVRRNPASGRKFLWKHFSITKAEET